MSKEEAMLTHNKKQVPLAEQEPCSQNTIFLNNENC